MTLEQTIWELLLLINGLLAGIVICDTVRNPRFRRAVKRLFCQHDWIIKAFYKPDRPEDAPTPFVVLFECLKCRKQYFSGEPLRLGDWFQTTHLSEKLRP